MAEEERSGEEKADTTIANELIDFANKKRESGVHPIDVASALRHAAANFTAFAFRPTEEPLDTENIIEDFRQFLQYYDSHHRGEARPMTPLERFVKQVEME